MTTIAQPAVSWQDGDVCIAANVTEDGVEVRQTRNADDAAEGYYGTPVAIIPLAEAVAMARAILAAANDEARRDAEMDEWLDEYLAEQEDILYEQEIIRHGMW